MNVRPMGLIFGMPAEEYHAVDAFSASGMRHLARSPWHYRNRVDVVPTRPMINGTLAHCAVLEPDAMSSRYVVVPDDAPRRPSKAQWAAKNPSPDSVAAMAWWGAFHQDAGDRLIIPAGDYAITQAQLAAIAAEPELSTLLTTGSGEVSAFWCDPKTGVYCKARPDWLHPIDDRRVALLDIKSTADDTPEGFARSVARMGYHRQRAHYIRGVQIAGRVTVERWVFGVVSSEPPVLAVPYSLVDEAAQQGEDECDELLALYADCRRRDDWPAYAPAERMIDLPRWAKRSDEVEVSYVD